MHLFSPHGILDYVCPTHTVPRVFNGMANPVPYWNAYWLAAPWVDKIPTTGVIGPNAVQHVSVAVINDLHHVDDLREACSHSPEHFMDWLTTTRSISCLTITDILGSSWVATAIARAEEASARLAEQHIPQEMPFSWMTARKH